MVDTNASLSPFILSSYVLRIQHPRQTPPVLINPGGRPKLLKMMAEVVDNDYKGFMR